MIKADKDDSQHDCWRRLESVAVGGARPSQRKESTYRGCSRRPKLAEMGLVQSLALALLPCLLPTMTRGDRFSWLRELVGSGGLGAGKGREGRECIRIYIS